MNLFRKSDTWYLILSFDQKMILKLDPKMVSKCRYFLKCLGSFSKIKLQVFSISMKNLQCKIIFQEETLRVAFGDGWWKHLLETYFPKIENVERGTKH
jgi:hypothetical protein